MCRDDENGLDLDNAFVSVKERDCEKGIDLVKVGVPVLIFVGGKCDELEKTWERVNDRVPVNALVFVKMPEGLK
jgi:tagatose-1,6-bisphosphate aldolase